MKDTEDLSVGAGMSDMDGTLYFIRSFFKDKGVAEKDVILWRTKEEGDFLTIQVVGIPDNPIFQLEIEAINEWGTDHIGDSLDAMWEDYVSERGDLSG